MKKRGQASVETIIVLAMIVIFLIYIIETNQSMLSSVEKDYTLQKIKFTINTLTQSGNLVYKQGIGAKTRVRLSIPGHIQNISLGHRNINVTLNISDKITNFFRTLPFDINGSIPTNEGEYWFMLTSYKKLVNIEVDNS